MSPSVKLLLASDRVKLMVAVCPTSRSTLSVLTMTVGGVTSRLKLTLLLASAPSWLLLPAASVKRLLSTLTLAVVAPAVGVKVAL